MYDESNKWIYCERQEQECTLQYVPNSEQRTYLTFIYVNKLRAEGHVSTLLWHHTPKAEQTDDDRTSWSTPRWDSAISGSRIETNKRQK
jgi:hypothetical protein